MSDNILYAILALNLITLPIAILFFYKYYLKCYDTFVGSFPSLAVISSSKEIFSVNDDALKFFGFQNLRNLKHSHSSISDFFIEDLGCIDKHTYGKNWLFRLEGQKHIKVKMRNNRLNMEQYFYITVVKMSLIDKFLILFHDITNIEKEKIDNKEKSQKDSLTGVFNREKMADVFNDLMSQSEKTNEIFSVIIFDIDHFKRVNDTYGHNVGDRVLVELSRLINSCLRVNKDILARWGGEEFLIVSKGSNRDQAHKLALRLKSEVERYGFYIVRHITCSFGVTEFKPNDQGYKQTVDRADSALYEAKETGRNKVISK